MARPYYQYANSNETENLKRNPKTIQIRDEKLCSWNDANRVVLTAGNWDTFEQNAVLLEKKLKIRKEKEKIKVTESSNQRERWSSAKRKTQTSSFSTKSKTEKKRFKEKRR